MTETVDRVSVCILIPVLSRPKNIDPLMSSLAASLQGEEGVDVTTLFLCSPGDDAEIEALRERGHQYVVVPWEVGEGEFAKKINYGSTLTTASWIFTGADDLHFHRGWIRAALNAHIKTGCLVIGTNDMHNPTVKSGAYATHLLVHRDFLDRAVVDAPGQIFCELYSHNCVDSELVETARWHKMYAPATDSLVEHLHPIFRNAKQDAVYAKGRLNHRRDRYLFAQRRRLWKGYTAKPQQDTAARRIVPSRPAPVSRWPNR